MALELAKEICKIGHTVYIVSYPNALLLKEERNERLHLIKIEEINYPAFNTKPYLEVMASTICRLTLKYDIDIIHAHYVLTHSTAAILARDMLMSKNKLVKVVSTAHGTDIHMFGHNPSLSGLIEHSLFCSDSITYVCNYLKKEAETLFPRLKNKGHVINNFVNDVKFRPTESESARIATRKILGINEEDFIVYNASNYRNIKNLNLFLELATLLLDNGANDVRFLLLGSGPGERKLRESVSDKNLGDYFIFAGAVENVVPYINASDMALQSSLKEAMSLMLLEAMSCGLPIAAFDVGGNPEIITHGKNGYLFNSVGELLKYVIQLKNNLDLRSSMSTAGRSAILSNFSRKKISLCYEELYYNTIQ